jgi:hypothetical protein
MICVIALVTLGLPGRAQERMVLGPRQFEADKSGNGAVLCVWSVYLSVQAQTAACKLPRRPADDAMDDAVAEIDEFIIANSSLHPTHQMLEEFKRRAAASLMRSAQAQDIQKFCASPDLEHFRSIKPEDVRGSVKKLLETPREPVMNPCF